MNTSGAVLSVCGRIELFYIEYITIIYEYIFNGISVVYSVFRISASLSVRLLSSADTEFAR